MNQSKFVHPVYSKRGSTSPRNQRNVLTSDDKMRLYRSNAAKQGKSNAELLAEIQEFNRKRKLLGY